MVLLVPMRLRHAEPPDGVSFEVELDQYRRLTTDDVTIVAGRHRDDLRRFEHLDTSIGIHHVDAPLDEKADVCVHAVVAADVRFRVDGPLVPGWIDHPLDAAVTCPSGFEADATDVAADIGPAHIRQRTRT